MQTIFFELEKEHFFINRLTNFLNEAYEARNSIPPFVVDGPKWGELTHPLEVLIPILQY